MVQPNEDAKADRMEMRTDKTFIQKIEEWRRRQPRIPSRADSFSINLVTGRWGDFACDAKGGDVISLCAYLHNMTQVEAARRLSEMLGG